MAGFRDFILRGNVVDLAVGVIMGVAFGGIVDSMTKDVITPIIGQIGGTPDFASLTLGPIAIGLFLNAVIAFLIKAVVVYFLIVKPFTIMMARFYPPKVPGTPPPPSAEVQVLTEIRELLKRGAHA